MLGLDILHIQWCFGSIYCQGYLIVHSTSKGCRLTLKDLAAVIVAFHNVYNSIVTDMVVRVKGLATPTIGNRFVMKYNSKFRGRYM